MNSVVTSVTEHLEGKGIVFQKMESGDPTDGVQAFQAFFEARNCLITCRIIAGENPRYLRIGTSIGIKAREEKLGHMYEYAARVNHDLGIGSFQIDPNDGEITFVISVALPGMDISDSAIHEILGTAITTLDEHVPGLVAILYTDISAIEALRVMKATPRTVVDQAVARLLGEDGKGDCIGKRRRTVGSKPTRRVGRPRKRTIEVAPEINDTPPEELEIRSISDISVIPQQPRRRGRPRKHPITPTQDFGDAGPAYI